ncbi:MAG: hypothetical protein KF788_04980 [Piscinibacter sp.]|nr:hypothetical protein [Piscinibacter sp.]
MNTTAHDFVTVDMRGLKAALVARAEAERVSVSRLVRSAVARDLGVPEVGEPGEAQATTSNCEAIVKLSIRLTAEEAERFASAARAAGLSRGALLAGLVSGVPVLASGSSRAGHVAAVVASNAEVATLSRNIRDLTVLLRRGDVHAARPYREMLDALGGDLRRHLGLASRALAELRPRGAIGASSNRNGP